MDFGSLVCHIVVPNLEQISLVYCDGFGLVDWVSTTSTSFASLQVTVSIPVTSAILSDAGMMAMDPGLGVLTPYCLAGFFESNGQRAKYYFCC